MPADPITPSRAASWDNTSAASGSPPNSAAWNNASAASGSPPNSAAWDNTSAANASPPNSAAWNNASAANASPPNADPFVNATPDAGPVAANVTCYGRLTANLSSFSNVTGADNGVDLSGPDATSKQRMLLLTEQSDQAENGIYYFATVSTSIAIDAYFTSNGVYQVTGLTAKRMYRWVNGNGTSISNGNVTLTGTGYIAATASGTLTITGPASASITSTLNAAGIARATLANDSTELVADLIASGVNMSSTPVRTWWRLTATVTTPGTTPVVWENIQANIAKTDSAVGFPAFANTAPTPFVLPGEQAPVAIITAPTVNVVTQSATLVAGTNYLVSVGSRLSPVTINLPDPGSVGQTIEIIDATLQAGVYPITVNSGSKPIVEGASTILLSTPGSSLRLTYSGVSSTGWM